MGVDGRGYLDRSAGVVAAEGMGDEQAFSALVIAVGIAGADSRGERRGDKVSGRSLIRPYAPAAAWASARESVGGRSRPRLSARRRIPAQARALK